MSTPGHELQTDFDKSKKELLLKEYGEVLITYRENIKVLGAIITFVVIANVSIISFALQHENFYIFLPGAILMFTLYRANHRAAQITLPIVLRGLKIENEFGVEGIMNYTLLKIKDYTKFRQLLTSNQFYDKEENTQDSLLKMQKILNKFKNITLRFDLPFAISKSITYLIILVGVIQLGIFLYGLFLFFNKNVVRVIC